MYYNPNNSTYSQYNKGKRGEQVFRQWCKKVRLGIIDFGNDLDYFNIDFFTLVGTVDVKSNYNPRYNTVVVEIEQLGDGPDAWINHQTHFIAFIVGDDVYMVETKKLRELDYSRFKTYTRKQGRFKGTYKIAFVPLEIIKELSK